MAKKGAYYARRFALGKKFGAILLTGRKKGSGKLYYGKPRLVYLHACLQNANTQLCTVQTYNITTGRAVCTDSATAYSAQGIHVRVLWNSSFF